MNMNSPLVSVIIPTYNRKAYVQQAIDSVLAQTYPHYEIIVIDDGSTDGTGEALAARYGDRITYHRQENQGESVARNWGIGAAQGEYIAFLDDDDIYFPEFIEAAIEFLNQNPGIGLVCVQGYMLTHDGDITNNLTRGHRDNGIVNAEEMLFDWPAWPSNSIIRSEIILKTGGFDPEIRFGEDGDFLFRIFTISNFYFLARPLMGLRHLEHSQSGKILDPEKAHRRFKDHSVVLSRIEENPKFKEFMPQAWAVDKARFGMNQMANRNYALAEALLVEVFQHEFCDWFFTRVMQRFFRDYLLILDKERGIKEALDFSNRVFKVANRNNRKEWERLFLGELFATKYFRQAFEGNWQSVRQLYFKALYYQPSLIKNRGAHVYFLKSLINQ